MLFREGVDVLGLVEEAIERRSGTFVGGSSLGREGDACAPPWGGFRDAFGRCVCLTPLVDYNGICTGIQTLPPCLSGYVRLKQTFANHPAGSCQQIGETLGDWQNPSNTCVVQPDGSCIYGGPVTCPAGTVPVSWPEGYAPRCLAPGSVIRDVDGRACIVQPDGSCGVFQNKPGEKVVPEALLKWGFCPLVVQGKTVSTERIPCVASPGPRDPSIQELNAWTAFLDAFYDTGSSLLIGIGKSLAIGKQPLYTFDFNDEEMGLYGIHPKYGVEYRDKKDAQGNPLYGKVWIAPIGGSWLGTLVGAFEEVVNWAAKACVFVAGATGKDELARVCGLLTGEKPPPPPPPPSSSFDYLPWILGGAGVLVVGSLGVLALTKRKKKTP